MKKTPQVIKRKMVQIPYDISIDRLIRKISSPSILKTLKNEFSKNSMVPRLHLSTRHGHLKFAYHFHAISTQTSICLSNFHKHNFSCYLWGLLFVFSKLKKYLYYTNFYNTKLIKLVSQFPNNWSFR